MPKLTLPTIPSSGYMSSAAMEDAFNQIETAFENTLSRDGDTPNQMENVLDMNSHRIINLPPPGSMSDAARYQDITESTVAGAQDILDQATALVSEALQNSYVFKGEWNGATNYITGDRVKRVGGLYWCLTPNQNKDPVTSSQWVLEYAWSGGQLTTGLKLAATTAQEASINFPNSGLTLPTNPLNGDVWYNGGSLLFRNNTGVGPKNHIILTDETRQNPRTVLTSWFSTTPNALTTLPAGLPTAADFNPVYVSAMATLSQPFHSWVIEGSGVVYAPPSASNSTLLIGLFDGTTCIAAEAVTAVQGNYTPWRIKKIYSPGVITSKLYALRFAVLSGQPQVYMNGDAVGQKLGGAGVFLTLREVSFN